MYYPIVAPPLLHTVYAPTAIPTYSILSRTPSATAVGLFTTDFTWPLPPPVRYARHHTPPRRIPRLCRTLLPLGIPLPAAAAAPVPYALQPAWDKCSYPCYLLPLHHTFSACLALLPPPHPASCAVSCLPACYLPHLSIILISHIMTDAPIRHTYRVTYYLPITHMTHTAGLPDATLPLLPHISPATPGCMPPKTCRRCLPTCTLRTLYHGATPTALAHLHAHTGTAHAAGFLHTIALRTAAHFERACRARALLRVHTWRQLHTSATLLPALYLCVTHYHHLTTIFYHIPAIYWATYDLPALTGTCHIAIAVTHLKLALLCGLACHCDYYIYLLVLHSLTSLT